MTAAYEVFERFAAEIPAERAVLVRACAADPAVLGLVPEQPEWDVPHRVLAAVEYLVLGGEASYADPREFVAAVREHADWVERFVRERRIQTNEVQRCWALVPLFLIVARRVGRPLDLVELGTSAGLNLLWDRYRYEYRRGTWGRPDSPLVLRGDERIPVPGALLTTEVEIRRRLGIDLAPVDATTEEGARLLLSFTTDPVRRQRLRTAIEVLRVEPPELLTGDYVEALPGLLAGRDDDALTVVFQTISTIYLPAEERRLVAEAVEGAAREGPLAWVSTPIPEEHRLEGRQYPLELAVWPGGGRRFVAEMSNSGDWLEWWG